MPAEHHPAAEQKLQRAAKRAADARAALEAEIRDARTAGMSLRDIAELVGMSHEQVRRLTADEQPAPAHGTP